LTVLLTRECGNIGDSSVWLAVCLPRARFVTKRKIPTADILVAVVYSQGPLLPRAVLSKGIRQKRHFYNTFMNLKMAALSEILNSLKQTDYH